MKRSESVPPAARLRIAALLRTREPLILGVLGIVLFLAVWEGAVLAGLADPVFVSRPARVAAAIARQFATGQLGHDLLTSVTEMAVGFSLATVIGIPFGAVLGWYRSVEYTLDPFLWFLYSAPLVAFYPLFIIWLGLGFKSVVAMVFLLTVIPIAINTLTGVRGIDQVLLRAVRSFGGTNKDVFFKLVLPGALPIILAGLRIGVGRALIGMMLGEMFGATAGLGYRAVYYGGRLRADDILAPVILVVVLGIAGTQAIRLLEVLATRWKTA